MEFDEVADACIQKNSDEQELYGQKKLKRNVEWDGTTPKSIRTDSDGGVGYRVSRGDSIGFAYSNLSEIDPDWLWDCADKNCELVSPEEHAQLSGADQSQEIALEWFDDTINQGFADRKNEVTHQIEHKLETTDNLKNLQVEFQERIGCFELFRNVGLIAGEVTTSFAISAWAICESGDSVQSGFQRQSSYCYADLNIDHVLEEAIEEGKRKLGADSPESQTGGVLLNSKVTSGLLRLIRDMANGESVAKGRSAWRKSDRGNMVGNDKVTIIDDPRHSEGASCSTFDSEGYKSDPITIVDDGELNEFLTNQYVSNRLELSNNHRSSRQYASSPSVSSTNFVLTPGDKSFSGLEEELGDGPVVTSIQPGSGLDSVAGQFSVGASGYFVKNGKYDGSFDEATLSGTVDELLGGITAKGESLPRGYSLSGPPILVEQLSLGGNE